MEKSLVLRGPRPLPPPLPCIPLRPFCKTLDFVRLSLYPLSLSLHYVAARSTRQQVAAGAQAAPREFDLWYCPHPLSLYPLSLHLPLHPLSEGIRLLALAPLVFALAPTLLSWPLTPPQPHPTCKCDNACLFASRGTVYSRRGLNPRFGSSTVYSPPPYPVMLPLSSRVRHQRLPHQPWGVKGQPLRPKRRLPFFFGAFLRVPLSPLPAVLTSFWRRACRARFFACLPCSFLFGSVPAMLASFWGRACRARFFLGARFGACLSCSAFLGACLSLPFRMRACLCLYGCGPCCARFFAVVPAVLASFWGLVCRAHFFWGACLPCSLLFGDVPAVLAVLGGEPAVLVSFGGRACRARFFWGACLPCSAFWGACLPLLFWVRACFCLYGCASAFMGACVPLPLWMRACLCLFGCVPAPAKTRATLTLIEN